MTDTEEKIRVTHVITHPIPYLVPLLRGMSRHERIKLRVIFGCDLGVREYFDKDFGADLSWESDLLSGYDNIVLSSQGDPANGFWGVTGEGISRLIDKSNTDLVFTHGWGWMIYMKATMTALAKGLPVIYRTDTYKYYDPAAYRDSGPAMRALRKVKPAIQRQLFKKIDGFISIGSENEKFYRGMGVSPRKLFMVQYSIDPPPAMASEESEALRQQITAELGLSAESFRIVYCGKLVRRKRPFDIIEAVARMPSRKNVQVVFIGEGKLKNYLKELARVRKVNAVFAGFVTSDMLRLHYSLGHVLALPSSVEPWGLVVNEAMSMGLPAVVSDRVGCGPDLVREEQAGFVYPTGDVQAMAEVLEKIARSDDLKKRLSANALKAVARRSRQSEIEGFARAMIEVVRRRRKSNA